MNERSTAEKASDKFFLWDTDNDCSDEEDVYFTNSLDYCTAACKNSVKSDAKSVIIVRMSGTMKMMTVLPRNLKLHLCYPISYQEKMVLCGKIFHQELPEKLGHTTFLLLLPVFQEQLQEVL